MLEHAKSPLEAQHAGDILAPAEEPSRLGSEPPHHPASAPLLGGHGNLLDDDPVGTTARKRAQDPLAHIFEVVSQKQYDQDQGHRDQNEVTQKQLRGLRNLFNDIRDGDGSLKVDMHGKSRNAAMTDIARILQTKGGRQLINGLDHSDHTTTLKLGDRARTNGTHRSDGIGGNATVHYDPGQPVLHPNATDPAAKNSRSDVVLFHELVHARHDTNGTDARGVLHPEDVVDSNDVGYPKDEYQAVGLGAFAKGLFTENAYRRARRDIGAHSDTGVVPGDKNMPIRTRYKSDVTD